MPGVLNCGDWLDEKFASSAAFSSVLCIASGAVFLHMGSDVSVGSLVCNYWMIPPLGAQTRYFTFTASGLFLSFFCVPFPFLLP